MADQLATPSDLASFLQQGEADLDVTTATLLLEAATAVVQAATGQPPQRLVQVTGDKATLRGGPGSWLELPQRPVTAITSVTVDGTAVTEGTLGEGTYRRFGARLWRSCGWGSLRRGEPSTVTVVYDHGYPPDAQELQLARSAVLSLAAVAYSNPVRVTQERIDDYSVMYDTAVSTMETSSYLRAALQRQYGRSTGHTRI